MSCEKPNAEGWAVEKYDPGIWLASADALCCFSSWCKWKGDEDHFKEETRWGAQLWAPQCGH